MVAVLFACALATLFAVVGSQTQETLPPDATTTAPAKLFECNGSVGNFPDPDSNCSHSFFICGPEVAHGFPFICPNGLYYDVEFDRCDYFDQLPQCIGTPRPTIDPNITTTPFPVSNFQCNGRLGNFNDPEANCSHVFYICDQSGRRHPFVCPNELYFDEQMNQCLRFAEVPACSGIPRTTPSIAILEAEVSVDCSGIRDNVNFVYPPLTNCPEFFFQCVNGQSVKLFCLDNRRYDVRVGACRKPSEIPSCRESLQFTTTTSFKNATGFIAARRKALTPIISFETSTAAPRETTSSSSSSVTPSSTATRVVLSVTAAPLPHTETPTTARTKPSATTVFDSLRNIQLAAAALSAGQGRFANESLFVVGPSFDSTSRPFSMTTERRLNGGQTPIGAFGSGSASVRTSSTIASSTKNLPGQNDASATTNRASGNVNAAPKINDIN